MFDGSPPNAAMCSRTHESASTMSSIPALLSSPRARNPSRPIRCVTVTTTTSSAAASTSPLNAISLPDPCKNAPPCSHTSTGRREPSETEGVQTFRRRQSSLTGPPSTGDPPRGYSMDSSDDTTGPASTKPGCSCGADGPNSSASRTPVHAGAGRGGRNRLRSPAGAPYGTPRNTVQPAADTPRRSPVAVLTVTKLIRVPLVWLGWGGADWLGWGWLAGWVKR